MNLNSSFDNNYYAESLDWIDGAQRHYYPGAKTAGGRDGHIVKITPFTGEQWTGIFKFGDFDRNGISGIFTTPDSDKVCIVSRGAGYLVSTSNPSIWEEINCIPILGAIPILHHKILVFSNYTELVAYDKTGIKWNSERLSWDSFDIHEITSYSLKGSFWDYRSERIKTF